MHGQMTLRRYLYLILEPEPGGPWLGRLVTLFIISLVLLNVAANILVSMEDINNRYGDWLFFFEAASVLIFSVEYILRLWSGVESRDSRFRSPLTGRLRFAVTPMMIIDILAILPFYLMMWTTIDLMFLRVFRLFRIFKLTRYSPAMGLLITVLRKEGRAFGAAMFILAVILVFASSGIYLVEHVRQPEAFGSIPAAMWWAVATLTTVGYGDVTPVTPLGKLFGASITIVGVGMVALPAGILASAFSEELRKRREEFMQHVEKVLEGGQLSLRDEQRLESRRRSLGLEKNEAEQILRSAEENITLQRVCPHCGEPLDS